MPDVDTWITLAVATIPGTNAGAEEDGSSSAVEGAPSSAVLVRKSPSPGR
jgi:hypothetical protein